MSAANTESDPTPDTAVAGDGPWRGLGVAEVRSDPSSELRALRYGCGVFERPGVAYLEVLGEDRQRFLNGLVTCDVARLAPGAGAFGFFTTAKGKILSDVVILANPDGFRLELPIGTATAIRSHLEAYVVTDRVEIRQPSPARLLGLAGPRSREALAGAGILPEPAWGHVRAEILGTSVRLGRDPRLGEESWTLELESFEAEGLLQRLAAECEVTVMGWRAVEIQRVSLGVPVFGVDYGPGVLPQETGLDAAIDLDKGCYLGQEVVARLHYRGQAPRLVRRLLFDGDEVPKTGTPLLFEGREAGVVSSAVNSNGAEGVVGLALLQRRAIEPATRLVTPDEHGAVVQPLQGFGLRRGGLAGDS